MRVDEENRKAIDGLEFNRRRNLILAHVVLGGIFPVIGEERVLFGFAEDHDSLQRILLELVCFTQPSP